MSHPCFPTDRLATAPREADLLASHLGLTHTFAHLLHVRGFEDGAAVRRFLDPKLSQLTPPDGMAGRSEAVARIVEAIRLGQRIAIFGDYDCDGITSTAIMTEAIRQLGGEVQPLIGNRFEGGYGLSEQGAQRVADAKPGLLITCDCGSSDHERLDWLRSRGIDAVVVDHHLVPDEPLPVTAFLNPHQPGCGFAYKDLASCGLALNLAAGVRRELRPSLDVRQWLDLVAIGTVADMVPLDGDNRVLVRAGMKRLKESNRPGLRALAEQARIDLGSGVDGHAISFLLSPRLNAAGRLGDAGVALELLLERDANRARDLAAKIESLKKERQQIQARILEEALEQIRRNGFERDPALVLGDEGWHPGVVGIVASQLVEMFGKPAVVVAFDGEQGRGSVRGPDDLSVYELLSAAEDSQVRFGGHHAAAGVTLDSRASLERLREKVCAAAMELQQESEVTLVSDVDVLLDPRDEVESVVRDLGWLEPCGMGNPEAVIGIREAVVERSRAVQGGHLQLAVRVGDKMIRGFWRSEGESAEVFLPGSRVDVAGALRWDSYWGGDSVEMSLRCVHLAG